MTIRNSQFLQSPVGRNRHRFALVAAVLLLSTFAASDANAQGLELGSEEYGVRGRVGFLGGETVGRTESLTHFELMPYLRTPNGMLMSDMRFFVSDGEVGGNIGVGYREMFPELNRAFGGILWYDIDNLSGEQTQQVTLSFETYGEKIDALANIYIPVGDERVGALTASNQRFVGDQLLFDQSGTLGDVLGGGDFQVGYLLPGQIAEQNQLRAFAGFYHYSGSTADDINGFMGRIEATLFDMVDTQIKITDDDTFGTNVLFGVSIGLNRGFQGNQWRGQRQDQLTRYPTRQYNAVVVNADMTRTGVAATNPDTGEAFTFTHAASGGSGLLDGSAENPFDNIQLALAQDTDYHIVRGDSVFTGSDAAFALTDGNRLIGNSSDFQQELTAQGVGSLLLPTVEGSAAPILRGTAGDTATLASNTEFRGFTIEDSGGNGVVLSGIDNALVSNLTVLNASANGVLAEEISGSVSILDTTVSGAGAAALRIDSITGAVLASGEFTNDTGEALVLNDIGEDADINLEDATFSNETGSGLSFSGVDGEVAINSVSLTNSSGNGINIDGGTGTIRFAGETVIEGALGDAVRMHNSDATVEFETLTIRDAGGAAISIFNNTNTASLTVTGHTLIEGAADGIRVQDNLANTTFESVEIDGRLNHGILIDNTDGQFVIVDTLSIGNSEGATDSAIEVTNSGADVGFIGRADITDATGDSAVYLNENTGITAFANLNIDATDGAAVTAINAGTFRIVDGSTTTENGAAFDIEGTDTDIALASVSVTGGDFGIRLLDSTGSFVVNGLDDFAGAGGFITGTTTGIIAENAGTIGIRYLDLDDNDTAISIDTAERLAFFDGSITNSSVAAASLLNVESVEFVSSTFDGNGSLFSWEADTDGTYSWLLNDVAIDAGNGQALFANGTGGADVAITIQNSTFISTGSNMNLVDIQGNGALEVAMVNNIFEGSGTDIRLLNISGNSESDLSQFTLAQNLFNVTGASSTAVNTVTLGPSEILYDANTINFTANRGIGLDFTLAGSATVGVYSNLITDEFDGATGVLFSSVAGPSRIEIINNDLQFANLGGLSDRGFIFDDITGDVTLLGETNNIVENASTSVFVPSGRTTGSFLVNGVRVP